MNAIPGPGHGPLEGAVENHGTQTTGSAGRPANTCATCGWWRRLLSPSGQTGICHERWRDMKWNDAVPITTASETCDQHEARASLSQHADKEGET